MPEVLSQTLSIPGLGWMVLAIFLAGMVRGFAGFGTALVALPILGQYVPPIWTIVVIIVADLIGASLNVPRALRDGQPKDVGVMLLGAVLALPVGLSLLLAISPELFRYIVSVMALIVPGLLMVGFRLRRPLTRPILFGAGAASGILGGLSGLAGPPVILLFMASSRPVAAIRGNIMAYLFGFALLTLLVLWPQGRLDLGAVMLGLVLAGPNLAGNMLGAAIFRPDRERLYRVVGYTITAVSALSGLPLWD